MILLFRWMEMKKFMTISGIFPDAFQKLKEGVQYIKSIDPAFQDYSQNSDSPFNFSHWPAIIDSCKRDRFGSDQFFACRCKQSCIQPGSIME